MSGCQWYYILCQSVSSIVFYVSQSVVLYFISQSVSGIVFYVSQSVVLYFM